MIWQNRQHSDLAGFDIVMFIDERVGNGLGYISFDRYHLKILVTCGPALIEHGSVAMCQATKRTFSIFSISLFVRFLRYSL